MKKIDSIKWLCKSMGTTTLVQWLLTGSLLLAGMFTNVQNIRAQSNITNAEYYIDQDPGLNNGIPLTITPGTTVSNLAVTFNLSSISTGAHFFGARAKNANGVWSMNYFWIFFKPYQFVLTPGALNPVTKVEYYVDTDPGLGKAINVPVGAGGTDLANLTFNIDPAPLSQGVHMIGSRCQTSDGKWSLTNYWLFVKPYTVQATPAAAGNVNYVEYYLDQDPGVGKATPFSITPGVNLSDVSMPVNISALASGVHTIGARARDANGKYSQTNTWLFVKPYTNTTASAIPNVTTVEYYLDYDPGFGKGIAVPVTAGANLADLSFNVDISAIIPGKHNVIIRAKDANGNWSDVNSWEFTKPGTAPVLSTIVSATELCAGGTINVGWQLSSPVSFNANNTFVFQLSAGDYYSSFSAPRVIGTTSSTANSGSFTCTIPPDMAGNSYYRIRVVSTSQPILATDNGANIRINELPPVPSISSPGGDTTICQGNPLKLESPYIGYSPQWMKDNVPINGATGWSYTVANAASANAGVYKLQLTNAGVCNVYSATRTIAINTNVPSIPTLSPSGSFGVCLGNSQTLTSSSATFNQWFKNGEAIPGATGQTYAASTAGTYTVQSGNGTGCFAPSSNNAVITIGLPPVVPSITAGGATTFCQSGGYVHLLSSAFSGNQWFKNDVLIPSETGRYFYSVNTSGSYKVRVTNGGCDVFSDPIIVTVNPVLYPGVTLNVNTNNAPTGTNLVFTATPTNGGSAPVYDFKVNYATVQNGPSNTFTSSTLTSGQTVYCTMTTSETCINSTSATSPVITVNLLSPITLSGRVSHPSAGSIPTVSVKLTGDTIITKLSDVNGRYTTGLFQQRNYLVTPSKNNDQQKANGVNVLDVLQMQSHIVGSTLLNTPYKIIAADANSDGTVNIFDVLAVKRLILGIDTTFAGSKLWSFVDSTYSFPNAANPFPYASTKSYSNLASDQTNQSFIGVKLGDVTQDWNPGIAGAGRDEALETSVRLYYDTTYVENDDAVRIRIRVRDFKALYGMQFSLGFNADAFQFTGIQNKALPFSYNENAADKGVISFIWADAANAMNTLKDGTAIFDLVLRKKQGFLKEDIRLNNAFTPAIAFTNGYEAQNVLMNSGIILGQAKLPVVFAESLEVSPNPSNGIVKIVTNSKAGKKVELTVTDVAGRIVLTQTMEVNPGVNTLHLNLRRQSGLAPGVYYLHNQGLEKVGVKVLMIKDK